MKLSTGLDIVNGLSTCRDMFEAKAYLKANNIDISDQELEVLQSQYSKINSERTLTIRQLNNVAGGMYGMEAHRQEATQYGGEMLSPHPEIKGGVNVRGKHYGPGTYIAEQDSTYGAALELVTRLRVKTKALEDERAKNARLETGNTRLRTMINDLRSLHGMPPLTDEEFALYETSSEENSPELRSPETYSPESCSPPSF